MASTEILMTVAAREAIAANCAGTFSVGGLLADNKGETIKAMHNNVIVKNVLHDPTAHGERQLVDWYYSQKVEDRKKPEEVTVVTSLDPCCMCTGAILTAGFKVVVGAFDDFAGINYDKKAEFNSLPTNLQSLAKARFSYPKVSGENCFSRNAQGGNSVLPEPSITDTTVALCSSIFQSTLDTIRKKINVDLNYTELADIGELSEEHIIRKELKAVYDDTLKYRSKVQWQPDEGLAPYLTKAMAEDKKNDGPGNAVAMLDHLGHLLICTAGNHHASEIHTAFMLCTRAYAELREKLRKDPKVKDIVSKYLAHPKYCTFVFALGQNLDSRSFMDLGAYGSTMEGELDPVNPHPLQYVHPRISQLELDKLCDGLPTLYSRVIKVKSVQVKNQALIEAIQPVP